MSLSIPHLSPNHNSCGLSIVCISKHSLKDGIENEDCGSIAILYSSTFLLVSLHKIRLEAYD